MHSWLDILDPDTCDHDAHTYYAFIHDPDTWCIYQCSLILDSDACVYDAHIYDPRSLILIHACMMHLSMFLDPWLYCMCVWCTYLWSSIPDSDLCVYDAHIYDPRSLILMHVCMMHISMILDPNEYLHVSMMQIYMILDPDACVYDADMNDAYIPVLLLLLLPLKVWSYFQ